LIPPHAYNREKEIMLDFVLEIGKYLNETFDKVIVCEKRLTKIFYLFAQEMRNLSRTGMEVFFTSYVTTNGEEEMSKELALLGNPPRLKTLDLGRCLNQIVDDRVVLLAVEASDVKGSGDGIIYLDISGSGSLVTDRCMEQIAKRCATSLVDINVSFCHKFSDRGLGYLCEISNHQFQSIKVWGCAQLSGAFFDGHGRSDLKIEGQWLKPEGGKKKFF